MQQEFSVACSGGPGRASVRRHGLSAGWPPGSRLRGGQPDVFKMAAGACGRRSTCRGQFSSCSTGSRGQARHLPGGEQGQLLQTIDHCSGRHCSLGAAAASCSGGCKWFRLQGSVQNLEQWRGRDLALHADEFQSPVIFRRLTPALELARSVSVRLQQLAMFERLPSNAFLVWDVRGAGPDTFHHSRRLTVVGFRSQGPLLGAASFHLRLPDCATGLYLGVRQWQGHLRSYCRIDNLFRRGSRWAVGLNDALPMPHSGRERFQILPGVTNHFELRWNERSFAVGLNGQGVTRVRTIDMVAEATPPLAEVFVQVFCRNFRAEDQVACRPLPSSMAYNAEIECSICSRACPVAISRWAICPHCCTWACRSHVRDQPFRFCRHCTLLLADYVGGSAGADEYSAVYVTARGLWYEWQASDIDCVEDKFRRTISMILQQHCPLFLDCPLALDQNAAGREYSVEPEAAWIF